MSEYTEESLDKMPKRDLIPTVLNLQSTTTENNNSKNELLEEIRKFNNNFSKLQSELSVTKQVNTKLTKRIVTLERQCWAYAQYSRKECLEVVGIPRQVDDNQLETKVLSIFEVGCKIDLGFIDDCHRLGKINGRDIIKFARRKGCKQVLQVKKDLKELNTDDMDLPRGTNIFVNQSLCPYYRILWSKSKRLHSMGIINSFFVSGGTVKVKITENSRPLAITHLSDFTVHFPNVDFITNIRIIIV